MKDIFLIILNILKPLQIIQISFLSYLNSEYFKHDVKIYIFKINYIVIWVKKLNSLKYKLNWFSNAHSLILSKAYFFCPLVFQASNYASPKEVSLAPDESGSLSQSPAPAASPPPPTPVWFVPLFTKSLPPPPPCQAKYPPSCQAITEVLTAHMA